MPVVEESVQFVFRKARRRRAAILGFFAVLTGVLALTQLCSGPLGLTPGQIWQALVDPEAVGQGVTAAVRHLRLPVVLMSLIAGMSLAVSGNQMQTILNNPLASPFTLGVASAAALGAATGMVIFKFEAMWLVSLSAFAASTLVIMILLAVSKWRNESSTLLILAGVAVMFLCGAGATIVQFMADAYELQRVLFWSFGSFNQADYLQIGILGTALLLALPYFALKSWQLTAMRMGESRARGLGIPVDQLRRRMLLISSLLTALTVSFCGVIGFIGLVAPHLARLLIGEDQRWQMPLTLFLGASLIHAASLASLYFQPNGTLFPVGMMTSLIGAPFFLWMIFRKEV